MRDRVKYPHRQTYNIDVALVAHNQPAQRRNTGRFSRGCNPAANVEQGKQLKTLLNQIVMYLYIIFEDGESLKLTAEPIPAEKQAAVINYLRKGTPEAIFEYREN